MKFGKNLQRQIEETLPEWRDKFLCYKYLKKHLNFLSSVADRTEAQDASQPSNKRRRIDTREQGQESFGEAKYSCKYQSTGGFLQTDHEDANQCSECFLIPPKSTSEESNFIGLLNSELDKFNVFFVDKEEEYIIRQKELQERIEMVKGRSGPHGALSCESDYDREMIKAWNDIVNFHGEMILLENYSVLNYTGLMKIIKKYDKRTGKMLRLAFIERILQQPFFTTDVLLRLVKDCEDTLQHLFPSKEQRGELNVTEASNVTCNCRCNCKGEGILHRSTVAALRTIREMYKGSSTYSVFSLPPSYVKP